MHAEDLTVVPRVGPRYDHVSSKVSLTSESCRTVSDLISKRGRFPLAWWIVDREKVYLINVLLKSQNRFYPSPDINMNEHYHCPVQLLIGKKKKVTI